MAISKSDADKMRRLAQEGKQISNIVSDDFPGLDYWEVLFEIYSQGVRSSRGIKRMITNRLNTMEKSTDKLERTALAKELHGLIGDIYNNHKTNHEKLSKIRAILGE